MTRKLIEQMLEALNGTVYGEACFRKEVREAMEAARAYLAAPEQSEPHYQVWTDGHWNDVAKYYFDSVRNEKMKRVLHDHTAPQPTTPEPVNQMLLAACKRMRSMLAQAAERGNNDALYEVNFASAVIAAAEQAPQPTDPADDDLTIAYMAGYHKGKTDAQPTELTDEEIREIVYGTLYDGIYATVRACIAAAQKGVNK